MLKKIKILYSLFFLLVLYFPILMLIMNSFNSSTHSTEWEGFTLKWYLKLFDNYMLIEATKNSILLAFITMILTSIIATMISFGLYRYQYLGRKINYFFIQIMIMLPDIILGMSLLFFFTIFNIELGFKTLLISHLTLALPFAIMTILSGFNELDKNIIEVGRDLGASDYQVLKKLIIPIILPDILVASLITFTLSLDDVLISYFVSGPQYEVLPLKIFSLARIGTKPEVNAISSLMLLTSLSLISLSQILFKGKSND